MCIQGRRSDAAQLADAIYRLTTDQPLFKRLSKNSLLLAHREFDYEKNMIKMENIMFDVVGEH